MEKTIKNFADAQTLKALAVVCNHTTLPLVEKQAQEIKELKEQKSKLYKDYFKLMDELMEIKEWMQSYDYESQMDLERMEDGLEPMFNSRQEYIEAGYLEEDD